MAKKATAKKKSTGDASAAAAEEEEDVRYGAAVEEIERILESIDRDQIDVDDLSVKVERAMQLIRVCEKKLRSTEMRVREVLADLGEEGETPAEEATLIEQPAADRPADDDELPPLPADDELPF